MCLSEGFSELSLPVPTGCLALARGVNSFHVFINRIYLLFLKDKTV